MQSRTVQRFYRHADRKTASCHISFGIFLLQYPAGAGISWPYGPYKRINSADRPGSPRAVSRFSELQLIQKRMRFSSAICSSAELFKAFLMRSCGGGSPELRLRRSQGCCPLRRRWSYRYHRWKEARCPSG